MQKIFNHKSFNYFVWTPLGSRVNLYCRYIFVFKFTLRSQQPDIVPIIAKYSTVINNTSETGAKFASGVVDTGGYSGAGGKLIHEKNQKQKIL
jgi:hypothetical protein